MLAKFTALVPTERDVTIIKESRIQSGGTEPLIKKSKAQVENKKAHLAVLDELAAEGQRLKLGY